MLLVDLDLTCMTQHIDGGVLQLQTNLGGDHLTAGQNGDILQHFLPSVAKARRFDRNAVEHATQFVQHQRGQRFAFHILGNDQQLLAGLHDLLEQGQDILNVGNLLIGNQQERVVENRFHLVHIGCHVGRQIAAVELHTFHNLGVGVRRLGFLNGNHAVCRDLLHRVRNQLTDDLIPCGDRADPRDIRRAVDLLGVRDQRRNRRVNRLLHALANHHRVCARGHVLHALTDKRLRQQGCGGSPVACRVIGLGCNFLDQLRAHVLGFVLQLNLLRDGYAVVCDERRAVLLIEHHISALRTQCDFYRVRELIHSAEKSVSV